MANRYFVTPYGTPDWQDGYRDAMHHHYRGTVPSFEETNPYWQNMWENQSSEDYRDGYREGWKAAEND